MAQLMAQFFSNTRGFSLSNSSISCIARDQNIIYGSQTIINHSCSGRQRIRDEDDDAEDEEVEARKKRSRLKALLDDFHEFKRGDTMVLELIDGENSESNNVRVRKRIEAIKILSRNERFTSVTFKGTGAQEMWKETLEEFSRVRSADTWQLFGFTRSQSHPSLIFHHEEPVPVWEVYLRASPVVLPFILYRLKVDQCHLRNTMDVLMDISNAWIVPAKATLSYGPVVEGLIVDRDIEAFFLSGSTLEPFPGFWQEKVVIDYLDTTAVEFHGLFSDISPAFPNINSFSDNKLTDIMPLGQLFYGRCVVGEIPLMPTSWFKVGWQGPVDCHVVTDDSWMERVYRSESANCNVVVMQDGWTRVKQPMRQCMTSQRPNAIVITAVAEMTAESRKFLHSSWYSQAPWVFKQMGLDMQQHSVDFWMCDRIEYKITLPGHCFSILLGKDIFLFLPPVEQVGAASFRLKDDPFLSYDEYGVTRIGCSSSDVLLGLIPSTERRCLGSRLRDPFLVTSYYQRLKGYDPDTNAYAVAHGFPIFRFAPNFKEVVFKSVQEWRHQGFKEIKINPDGGKDGFLLPLLDGRASGSRIEEVDEEVEVVEYLTTEMEGTS